MSMEGTSFTYYTKFGKHVTKVVYPSPEAEKVLTFRTQQEDSQDAETD